jgi:hypothetical protein
MRGKLLLLSTLVLPVAVACGAPHKLTDRQFAPILAYYSSCSYVAEHSTPEEIVRFASLLRGSQKPRVSPTDARGRKVYDAMASTLGVVLHPDPGIIGIGALGLFDQYYFRFTPVEIVAAGAGSVSIRVTRTSTLPLTRQAQPAGAGPFALFQPSTPPAFSTTEVDEWVMVGGQWRLKALHAFLVSG